MSKRVVLDARINGTRCETCVEGRDLILSDFPKYPCMTCLDRPNRRFDKSHYVKDVEDSDVLCALDVITQKNSCLDY